MVSFSLATHSRTAMIDITHQVQEVVSAAHLAEGMIIVFVPHTTAAVTINENADPDVPRDILSQLERMVPPEGGYRHREGNADAHVKASLIGASETIMVTGGRLILGTWQSIFFCEFDGPRTRQVFVQALTGDTNPDGEMRRRARELGTDFPSRGIRGNKCPI